MGQTGRMECVNLLFLILLSSLSHTVRSAERTLDLAHDAVDDMFSGCRDRMLQAVKGGILQKELNSTKEFREMWKTARSCDKQNQSLTSEHLSALESYANSKPSTRKMFNDMVHTSGSNATTYQNDFTFKSLHFLLTDAMQRLNGGKACSTVFYGTNNVYTAKTRETVRFGKFIQSGSDMSSEEEKIKEDGEGTLFKITSCSVVNVENITCSSEEVEQLISPTEVFTVMNVKDVSDPNEEFEYKMITLNHTGFLSNHNCYLFDGISEATTPSSRDSTQAPGGSSSPLLSSTVLALLASILSLSYCTVPQ